VDNNYLDLGMNESGFVHTLPIGRLTSVPTVEIKIHGISYFQKVQILHTSIHNKKFSVEEKTCSSLQYGHY
jgi:hypothetical protein